MEKNNARKKKNKIKLAAAVRYDLNKDQVPVVIASGKGTLAEKIIEIAARENIAVYEDENVAQILTNLNIGQEIPDELYQIIAEILVFVKAVDNHL